MDKDANLDRPPAFDNSPNLGKLTDLVLDSWPQHQDYISLRFNDRDDKSFEMSEQIAGLVLELAGSRISEFCADYKWMCDNFMREEINFRSTGKYRLSTFQDAYDQIYSKPEYMSRYINGILLSLALWRNQAVAMQYYIQKFLGGADGGDHLEVGPGHGMLLHFAEKYGDFRSLTGWDVSESSFAATQNALSVWGTGSAATLKIQNILEPVSGDQKFDSVVISEVLEHLDHPDVALRNLASCMRPGGRIFVNVPVNSPAPDHIFLWSTPEQVVELVASCGFDISDSALASVTGHTVDSARKRKLTLNVLITGIRN
jgi:2-polyprenyl-3-methyl-5-hydroxy-6-metoxy-1,4-benzoquinol methylase